MHLERPSCGRRHISHPAVVAHDHALPRIDLGVHQVTQQIAAGALEIRLRMLQLGLQLRRDERVRVDLAVWVGERDADLLAVVLEREHLLDAVDRAQLGRAEGPCLHHRAQTFHRKVRRQPVLVGVEADHLATAGRRTLLPQRVAVHIAHLVRHSRHLHHRREAVFEHHDVVIRVGHLAVLIRVARLARRQRIAFRRRARACSNRPVHACRGHGNPVSGERVAAHLRCRVLHFHTLGVQVRCEAVVQVARVVEHARPAAVHILRLVVEVEEITAVRQRGRRDAQMFRGVFAGLVMREFGLVGCL